MKEFADDNFEFDEYGRKFSKWIENIVGKGGIAHSVFKRLVLQKRKKQGLFGKRLMKTKHHDVTDVLQTLYRLIQIPYSFLFDLSAQALSIFP